MVFGTLGYMAAQQGVAVTEVLAGGPSLVFVVFPEAISLMPAFNAVIAVLFFGMLLTLAIDSAFSIFEAVAASVRDRFPNTSQAKVAFSIMALAFIAGLLFVTKGGLYALDIVDHFVINYGIILIGVLEAILVGWVWRGHKLREFINEHSAWKLGGLWDFAIRFITPVFLIGLLIWNIVNEIRVPYEGYPASALIYLGVLPLVLAPIAAVVIEKLTSRPRSEKAA